MAVRRILLPWDSQPQEVADLDSRFTWGVNFAGGPSSIEIASKTFGTPTGSPTRAATPQGVGVKLVSGSSQHWIGPVARLPTAFPITFVATFTLDSLAVSARIFQSGMTYNYAGVYFWVFTNGAGTVGYGNNTDITTGIGNFQINFPAGTFVAGQTYTVSACCTAGNIIASVNGGEVAGTSLTGSSTTIATTGSPNVGRLQYAGLELYTDATISLVALGGFISPQGELNGYSSNPWQLFAPRPIWVPVSAGGGAPTLALTGYAATGSAGILVPALSLAVAGNGATAAQGTATPSLSKAITGNAVTASAGTPVASISLALTGNAATASVGTVGIGGTTQALTGNAATASAGTPVAVISLALTGNGATSSVGTATPALSKAITGNAATTAVGTPVAGLSLALSGNGATSACGTVEVPGVIVPSSNVATTATGTVTPGISIALTGNGATASVGSVSPAISLALSGLAGTSSAGIVIPGLSLALSGNAAAAATGTIAVATGDATVALTGNLATAYAGSLGIGGAVGLSEWWRYDVPVNDMRYAVPVHNLRYDVDTENLT